MINLKHNHVTRDIKEFGKCPVCDHYSARDVVKKLKEEKDKLITLVAQYDDFVTRHCLEEEFEKEATND